MVISSSPLAAQVEFETRFCLETAQRQLTGSFKAAATIRYVSGFVRIEVPTGFWTQNRIGPAAPLVQIKSGGAVQCAEAGAFAALWLLKASLQPSSWTPPGILVPPPPHTILPQPAKAQSGNEDWVERAHPYMPISIYFHKIPHKETIFFQASKWALLCWCAGAAFFLRMPRSLLYKLCLWHIERATLHHQMSIRRAYNELNTIN